LQHHTILQENLFQSAMNLKLGRRLIFHHDNDPQICESLLNNVQN
uniref:Uncharacterized protein n=1 Tax=Erpetoichthys calabaricus TaxID=27687 RepID=A0A8C4T607_ERPCA